MAHTALICIWYRHRLSGFNAFDAGIIFSWNIKDMGCNVIHPVILVVFACQALPEYSACLHGLYCMAVNAVYYAFFSKAYFVLHMFLYATILFVACCAERIIFIPYILSHLMFNPRHAMRIMAVSA